MIFMKNIVILLNLLFLAIFIQHGAVAECDPDEYAESCISKLGDGFTFLKSFKIDGQGGSKSKIEYSYVFSKDTQYSINICADGSNTDGIIVNMYDSNRRQVATNFANGKFYDGLDYPCSATGIYYITFTFENSTKHCGGSVLGFKR